MIDPIATIFLLPLSAFLILVYLQNRAQATALGQMADSLEELHLLQLKNRRDRVQKDLKGLNPLVWLGAAAGSDLELEKCLEVCSSPSWINLRMKNGNRLVVSPLSPATFRRNLPDPKTLGRLGKAFEPLLGHSPRRVRIFSRSLSEQENFDLEAAEVGRQLGTGWGEVTRLWFYLIPGPKQA